MDEIWRPIPGWEDLYEVSSHGRVRSFDRDVRMWCGRSYGTKHYKGTELRQHTNKSGYKQVGLSRGGKSVTRYVHQLVAEAFYGPRPAGHQVRHWDGNPGNNQVTNLRYGTRSDNIRDIYKDRPPKVKAPKVMRTHCGRGHRVEYPNIRLKWDGSDSPSRRCLACHRSWNVINGRKKHGTQVPDIRELSDLKYAEIMEEYAHNLRDNRQAIPERYR